MFVTLRHTYRLKCPSPALCKTYVCMILSRWAICVKPTFADVLKYNSQHNRYMKYLTFGALFAVYCFTLSMQAMYVL